MIEQLERILTDYEKESLMYKFKKTNVQQDRSGNIKCIRQLEKLAMKWVEINFMSSEPQWGFFDF